MAPKNSNLGARRVATQGRPLSPEFKRAIVLVKDYFDRTKGDLREQEGSNTERTAHALGVGLATVKRVMADSKRSPAGVIQEESIRRGRPPQPMLLMNLRGHKGTRFYAHRPTTPNSNPLKRVGQW